MGALLAASSQARPLGPPATGLTLAGPSTARTRVERAFPGSARLALVLEEQRRFTRGAVYLHYRSAASP